MYKFITLAAISSLVLACQTGPTAQDEQQAIAAISKKDGSTDMIDLMSCGGLASLARNDGNVRINGQKYANGSAVAEAYLKRIRAEQAEKGCS